VLAGLQMFAANPVIGVGLDQFPIVFRARFGALAGFDSLANSHTSIVTILAEMGVVGFALVAYIYWSGWRCFRRSARDAEKAPLAIALWVGCLVILAMSQTEGRLLGDTNLWLFFGLLSSVAAASSDSTKVHEGHSPE
jgi:O-antigen ligase